jgi:hypothetical protein
VTVPVIILAVIFYGLVAYGAIIAAGQHRRARDELEVAPDASPLDPASYVVDVAAIEADGSVDAPAQDASDPVAAEAPCPPPTVMTVHRGPLSASRTTRRLNWH